MTNKLLLSLLISLTLPALANTDAPVSTSSALTKSSASRSILPTTPTANKLPWANLTPTQQEALQPLAAEWNKLSASRQKKWLVISNKFPHITADERARIQQRMTDWVKLSPEQRRAIRENYYKTNTIKTTEKSAHWENYQNLSDEEKKHFSAQAQTTKRITNLPPAHASTSTPAIRIKKKPSASTEASAPSASTTQ